MSDITFNTNDFEYRNIPLSELRSTNDLSKDDFLLVSKHINPDNVYNSRIISYENFSQQISTDLEIQNLRQIILSASDMILSNSTSIKSVGSESEPHIICGIKENNFGVIDDISSISLSSAMSHIFDTNTFNQICAVNSPWVLKSNIVSDIGDDENKVASQKLANVLSNEVSNNYIKKSSIVNDINYSSSDNVASQNLIKSLSNEVSSNFITNDRIESEITTINDSDNINDNVASIGLIKELSDIVDRNYIKKSQIVNVLSEEPLETNIASEKLINDLSNTIEQTYTKVNEIDAYVPRSWITDEIEEGSSQKVASQKLAKGLSDEIDRIFPSGRDGEVYFATNGTVTKKTLMDLNVFVCEDENDVLSVKSFPNIPMTRNMFADWEIGACTENNGIKWYGYDNDFLGGGSDGLARPGFAKWERLSSSPTIITQRTNPSEHTFCTTPYATNKFDITLSAKSTSNDDNDTFGIVASYIEDDNGTPHTLIFACHGGDTVGYLNNKPHHFACFYDNFFKICISKKTDINDNIIWKNYSQGILMRVIRDGNKLSAITGEPSDTSKPEINYNDDKYRIEIDLKKLSVIPSSSTDDIAVYDDNIKGLSIFRDKPGKIGVYNFSQEATSYTFPDFNTKRIIINAQTNEIYSYYKYGNVENIEQITDKSAFDYVGVGRFTKNTITNKTFYVTQTGFIKVSEL